MWERTMDEILLKEDWRKVKSLGVLVLPSQNTALLAGVR